MADRPHRDFRRSTLAYLLMALTVLQFGYPITLHGRTWTALYMAAYGVLGLSGIRVIQEGDDDVPRSPFISLAILMGAAAAWFTASQHDVVARTLMLLSVGLFQLALLVTLARYILRSHRAGTGSSLILAAVSAYLLLGGVFGVAANLLETRSPGSFVDNSTSGLPLVWQGLQYQSYVTLTTLGYGDVLPVSPWARSLTTLESVIGVLFLAIVIARLVGSPTDEAPAAGPDAVGSGPSEPGRPAPESD
ncbi:MAG: potassium channel family protein [Acidimicrobiales bacterium]